MWQLARKWTACAAVLGTTTLALVSVAPAAADKAKPAPAAKVAPPVKAAVPVKVAAAAKPAPAVEAGSGSEAGFRSEAGRDSGLSARCSVDDGPRSAVARRAGPFRRRHHARRDDRSEIHAGQLGPRADRQGDALSARRWCDAS